MQADHRLVTFQKFIGELFLEHGVCVGQFTFNSNIVTAGLKLEWCN